MRLKVYLNRATLCGALGMHGEALGYSSLLFPRYCLKLGIQSSNLGQGIASCIFRLWNTLSLTKVTCLRSVLQTMVSLITYFALLIPNL